MTELNSVEVYVRVGGNVPKMPSSVTNGRDGMSNHAGLRLVETAAPNAVSETKRPKRFTNAERRPREHLTREEVLQVIKAARSNRHGARERYTVGRAGHQRAQAQR
jgi:hypothetical protein